MNKFIYNHSEPTTIPAPTKPDTASPTTTPNTKPGNDPWKVPSPSVNPTPKAFLIINHTK